MWSADARGTRAVGAQQRPRVVAGAMSVGPEHTERVASNEFATRKGRLLICE